MALNYSSDPNKCNERPNLEAGSPVMSAVMFTAGAAGNIIALVLLDLRRRRRGSSLFQTLLTALVVTDLLGTTSVSPVVLASYAWNRTLVSMSPGGEVCKYFGFSMAFFSLSTLSVLCAMAMERCVSIGSPYFYERHFTNNKHCGHVALSLIYVACFLFCVSPFAGYGSYVQYCPGTWCFLNMHPLSDRAAKVYTGLYASFTLVMISGTVGCNVCVMYCLVKMHRRHNAQRSRGSQQPGGGVRRKSLSVEVEHLLLMSFITVVFILCSSPIVLRVYINLGRMEEYHKGDLPALRLLSLNSILNPWVFIILRPSVQRFIWRKMPRPHKSKLTPGSMALTVQPTLATRGPPVSLLNQAGDRG